MVSSLLKGCFGRQGTRSQKMWAWIPTAPRASCVNITSTLQPSGAPCCPNCAPELLIFLPQILYGKAPPCLPSLTAHPLPGAFSLPCTGTCRLALHLALSVRLLSVLCLSCWWSLPLCSLSGSLAPPPGSSSLTLHKKMLPGNLLSAT